MLDRDVLDKRILEVKFLFRFVPLGGVGGDPSRVGFPITEVAYMVGHPDADPMHQFREKEISAHRRDARVVQTWPGLSAGV